MAVEEASWSSAQHGDFAGLVAAWPHASPAERAAIDALLSLVTTRRPPSPESAGDLQAARALRALSLRALVLSDGEALSAIARAQSSIGEPSEQTLRWSALFGGRPDPGEGPREVQAEGRIETGCLQALYALFDGDVRRGVQAARRAVRMARAEGLVLYELLSSLVLARGRRLEGRPHLAVRILGSVAQVAPPLWQGWLRYEQWLSGEPVETAGDFVPFAPLEALHGIREGAARGDSNAIDRALQGAPPWVHPELSVLAESIDPTRDARASPPGWLDGTDIACPHAILGLCVPDIERDGELIPVLLDVRPDRPARRVLAMGAALVAAPLPTEYDLSQVRTHSAIAHLATGPDENAEALFQRVYGFAYDRDRHDGAFRVLLHRVRKALPDGLTLQKNCRLEVGASVLIPDTRLEFEQETLVLRHLAHNQGRASTKGVASALRISVRSVQNMLRALVDDGTCTSVRSGNAVEYRLEGAQSGDAPRPTIRTATKVGIGMPAQG
ncbi:MAG: hypothetical protein AAF645_16100, partial [Myxococcota bacterium]